MGESITSGSLAKWMINVGDSIKQDAVVAIIDTDKVDMSIM
jgi:pyruvate/2-oxoglutarate dehydrogenase complex dihydrolipoamide acyltransferase (E2) component